MNLTEAEDIRRGGKNTQKKYIKKKGKSNGVALIVTKESKMQYLGSVSKTTE